MSLKCITCKTCLDWEGDQIRLRSAANLSLRVVFGITWSDPSTHREVLRCT
jgi:hypothetical protein